MFDTCMDSYLVFFVLIDLNKPVPCIYYQNSSEKDENICRLTLFGPARLRRIYWADWDRDGPKIEMSNMDGTERSVLVEEDLGLPNGLTLDADNQQLCWADAGEEPLLETFQRISPHALTGRSVLICRNSEGGVHGSAPPAQEANS